MIDVIAKYCAAGAASSGYFFAAATGGDAGAVFAFGGDVGVEIVELVAPGPLEPAVAAAGRTGVGAVVGAIARGMGCAAPQTIFEPSSCNPLPFTSPRGSGLQHAN